MSIRDSRDKQTHSVEGGTLNNEDNQKENLAQPESVRENFLKENTFLILPLLKLSEKGIILSILQMGETRPKVKDLPRSLSSCVAKPGLTYTKLPQGYIP